MIHQIFAIGFEVKTFRADLIAPDKLCEFLRSFETLRRFQFDAEIQFKCPAKCLRSDDSTVVAVGENSKRKIFFRDEEEIGLLSVRCTAMCVSFERISVTDKPCDT